MTLDLDRLREATKGEWWQHVDYVRESLPALITAAEDAAKWKALAEGAVVECDFCEGDGKGDVPPSGICRVCLGHGRTPNSGGFWRLLAALDEARQRTTDTGRTPSKRYDPTHSTAAYDPDTGER